jgi:small subunit ribosomal protein S6
MREYELVYLISDSVAEEKISAVLSKVKKMITGAQGELLAEENLGRRRLAYEIKKNQFATYIQVNFKLEGEKLRELDQDLRLSTDVIRHLIVLRKMNKISVLEEKIEVVDNQAVEEAIGGERSFEQVEGETEESRNLMAKRGIGDSEETDEKNAEESPVESKVDEKKGGEDLEETIIKEKKIKKSPVKITEKSEVEAPEEKKQPVKKTVKKTKTDEPKDEPKIEKPEKKETAKKVKKSEPIENEADRLRALDEKLDQILGDDL